MKKNDDNKYIRIGIFAVVFLLGLFVSIKEKNGWIALIACVGVPLLYIPYGISDWKRRKQDNPPEKQNKPAKPPLPKLRLKRKTLLSRRGELSQKKKPLHCWAGGEDWDTEPARG